MLTGGGFELIEASYPENHDIAVEIHFNGKIVAVIDREKGRDALEIEFPGPEAVQELVARRCDLQGFLNAVAKATKLLHDDFSDRS